MRAMALAGPLILVALVCARTGGRSPVSAHAHVFVAQELVLAAGAAVLAAGAAWTKLRVRRDPVTFAIAALVALEVLSVAAAGDRWLAARSATLWAAGLTVFVVARAIRSGARELALSALLLPLGLVATSVIGEALGLVSLAAHHHAPGGLLGERNVAAELLVAGAPAVGWASVADGPAWRRRAGHAVIVLGACAVVLTRTRSAWLAALALVGAVVAIAAVRASLRGPASAPPRARVVALLGAAAFGVVLAISLPSTLRWRSERPYRDSLVHLVDTSTPSGHGRLVQYATTWRMASASPLLGVGPGNWAARYLSFAERGDRTVHLGLAPVNRLPNSDLFGFAAERGLVALGVLALLVGSLVRRGGPSRPLRGVRRATLGVVAVMAALDAVLQTPAALLLVAWVLGVCSASTVRDRHVLPGRPWDRRWSRPAFAVAATALVVACVFAGGRVLSVRLASVARGSDELDRAARLDPGDFVLRLAVAESWIADGRCDRAREHLDSVARSSPASPALGELEARCSTFSRR